MRNERSETTKGKFALMSYDAVCLKIVRVRRQL